jgi:hypothetical protein
MRSAATKSHVRVRGFNRPCPMNSGASVFDTIGAGESLDYPNSSGSRTGFTALGRSQVRRRRLRRGRHACKPRILGIGADSGHHEHRSPQHERGNRRERMTVDLPQINRPARAAARAEHIEPGRPCDRRGPYRPRAARPTACGKGSVNFAFGDVLIAENVPEAQALVSVRESRRVEYIALAPAVYRSYIRRMCNDYE